MESTPKNKMSIEQLKAMEYPIGMIAFILIVLALFFSVARFLSTSINSAISSPNETQIQAQLIHIDEEDYALVGTKLHLPAIQSSLTGATTTSETPTAAAGTTTVQTTPLSAASEPQPAESKSAFSLAVYNTTKKSGIAGTVKNDLVTAGFTVTKTGNKTPQEPQTLVQIKERVQASSAIIDEILSILGKRFAIGDPQILDSTSPYDIVITIGAK